MHLLFVVPYVPTPIRTRPYNLIRRLARRGHSLTLATLWSGAHERETLKTLRADGIEILSAQLTRPRSLWNCARTLPSATPLQAKFCWQPELARQIDSHLAAQHSPFDVINVEHLRGSAYALHLNSIRRARNLQIPIVWDSVDCITSLFRQASGQSRNLFGRVITRFELPRTGRYEARLAQTFDQTLVASHQDAHAFQELIDEWKGHRSFVDDADDPRITVLPNGVDLEYFAPNYGAREAQTIVLTGKMSYHANVTAALYLLNEIMPRVWQELPDALVHIVGQNPPASLTRRARESNGRVIVTGYVEDLRPYLACATLAVAPIVYSAGIQNKMLEAMAMATPVVATPQAISALALKPNVDVLVAEAAQTFSEQLVRLLRDSALAANLGRNGRAYVELNHDWVTVAERLEKVYKRLLENYTPPY
jgi:glycosyltransferase involved in cell wall biosynthesis